MAHGHVRAIALAIIRRGDDIFVAEGHDATRRLTFYRPLGGTIEFGEPARDTVARELQEEIGAQVKVGRYLGALENIFVYASEPGHEIALLFEGEFTDPSFYERPSVEGSEDGQSQFLAWWKPLSFFREGGAPLFPDGLLELLDAQGDG